MVTSDVEYIVFKWLSQLMIYLDCFFFYFLDWRYWHPVDNRKGGHEIHNYQSGFSLIVNIQYDPSESLWWRPKHIGALSGGCFPLLHFPWSLVFLYLTTSSKLFKANLLYWDLTVLILRYLYWEITRIFLRPQVIWLQVLLPITFRHGILYHIILLWVRYLY